MTIHCIQGEWSTTSCSIQFTQIRKNYWEGGSGLNFTDSLQISSLMCSTVHDGCSKSKLNGMGVTGSSLMSWSDDRYGWHSASSTANKSKIQHKYKKWEKLCYSILDIKVNNTC
jgi:hypothetical protein